LTNLNGEHWTTQANCLGVDTELFFPPRDKALYKVIADQAKVYCFGGINEQGEEVIPCPVRAHCLWGAITDDEQHGIFGGLSHRERNALVRKWQKQYKNTMTLKEYVFQLNQKGKSWQSSSQTSRSF
jgi:hypothetical protein